MILTKGQIYIIISESSRMANTMTATAALTFIRLRNKIKEEYKEIFAAVSAIQEDARDFSRLVKSGELTEFEAAQNIAKATQAVNKLLEEPSSIEVDPNEFALPENSFGEQKVSLGFMEAIEPFLLLK